MNPCTEYVTFKFSIFSIIILLTLKRTCVNTLSTDKPCSIINPVSVWRKEEYPNPRVDVDSCGRNCTKSWICDPSNIIPAFQADRLDKKISRIASSGECKCSECSMNDGYNISIALVPRMMITSGSTKRAEAKQFGNYLRMKWDFQKCGNNVLIFISKNDRQVYTAAGPDAYKILTLDKIEQVYIEVKPVLARGDFTAALSLMLTRYEEIFSNEYVSEDKDSYSRLEIVGICLAVIFLLCLIGGCCFHKIVSHYCKKEEPKLSTEEQQEQSDTILRDYYKNRKYKPTIIYKTKTEDTSTSRTYSSSRKGGGSYSSGSRYSSSYRSNRYSNDRSCYGGGGGGSSGFSGGSSCDGGGGGGGDF